MGLISIRNLAIIDMALHGRRFILIEFLGAVIIAFTIGGYILLNALTKGHGIWIAVTICGIGFNYLPLAIYALRFKTGQHIDEKLLSGQSKKKYTIQSLLLLIPFLIMGIAVFQAFTRSK